MVFYGKDPTPNDFNVNEQSDLEKEFDEKAMESLKKMKEVGYLDKGEKGGDFIDENGYGKNTGWKVVATILGILFIVSIIFIGYCLYDEKIQFTANPTLICENQTCEPTLNCPEIPVCPTCPSFNISFPDIDVHLDNGTN